MLSSIVILTASSAIVAIPADSARAAETHSPDVLAFGDAPFLGSTGLLALAQPIVGMAATPSAHGYYSVASDGGIFSFGDARFFGSTGALRLNRPIVGMAASASGRGYWLVASDGGIFSFGDARFFGSTGALRLNRPIVGMAASASGRGYRFVATDGGIFSFGDARYHGSLGGATHSAPIVGMATTPSGNGYWLADAAGAVTGFGDAVLARAAARVVLPASEHVDSIVAEPAGEGYWLSLTRGAATNPKVEAAIAWFESRMGSSSYEGRCETAVENAFGTDSRYPTAIANWYAQPVHHADWQNAPRGAIVYYDTSSSGHVAISLGDGRVVSTSINGRIGIAATGFLQNPLGWADSPFL